MSLARSVRLLFLRACHCRCSAQQCQVACQVREEVAPRAWRWVALAVLSLDICISYVPQYTFVPILRQGMHAFHVDEPALNMLCILYALVYVPGAFVTGPLVGAVGCRRTFVLATALIAAGCALRCNSWSGHSTTSTDKLLGDSAGDGWFPAYYNNADFMLLLAGQGLCALGQPLLVNCTSEMGADWFPPSERPAAAMISNLMNFVGGSLSFVIPPLFVDDNPTDVEVMHSQISSLLSFQFHSAILALVLTYLLYRPLPADVEAAGAEKRQSVPFLTEVKSILRLKDFWIVNLQFTIFIALCHAFDAVEGSLLENYGYNASLTSWTAVSCGITSILSTIVEARCITNATYYKVALMISNSFMAMSLLVGFLCLHYQWHSFGFITAVGIMGLATPGWGCSAELGSEVCFPAREATVNGLMEAFSNLAGVAAIVMAQEGIDQHLGAGVLAVMATTALAGALLLVLLSGRLRRCEMEESPRVDEEDTEVLQTRKQDFKAEPSLPVQDKHEKMRVSHAHSNRKVLLLLWAVGINLASVAMTATTAQFIMPKIVMEPAQMAQMMPSYTKPKKRNKKHNRSKMKNGVREPRTFLLNCGPLGHQQAQMARGHIASIMSAANQSFAVFPCVRAKKGVTAAFKEGLLSPKALDVWNRHPGSRAAIEVAASHMRLWKLMANQNIQSANIIEDSENLCFSFRSRRNELLGKLPLKTDFVALNPRQSVGSLDQKAMQALKGKKSKHGNASNTVPFPGVVNRLKPGTGLPVALNNYYITLRWAKKFLRFGVLWEAPPKAKVKFEHFLFDGIYRSPQAAGFRGYALEPGAIARRSAPRGGQVIDFRSC